MKVNRTREVSDQVYLDRIPTTFLDNPIGDTDNTNATEVLNNMTSLDYTISYGSELDLTLNNYNGSSSHIGLSMDAKANPSIWYIGSDASPHSYSGDATGNWTQSPSQDETKWPLADDVNAELTVTSYATYDKVWLFYVIDGTITMLVSTGGSWDDPVPLIPYNTTTEAAGTVGNTGSPSSGGLSYPSKVGIGVGVGVGVPVVAAALALCLFLHTKRSRQAHVQKQETQHQPGMKATLSTAASPPVPWPSISDTPISQYKPGPDTGQRGYWVDGIWVPTYTSENKPVIAQVGILQDGTANRYTGMPVVESDSAQVYEMAHDERAHEMSVMVDTAASANHQRLEGRRAEDGFVLSVNERPHVCSRMVEQL